MSKNGWGAVCSVALLVAGVELVLLGAVLSMLASVAAVQSVADLYLRF